ncbi:helix-turn-helix domain-containing protein [Streptomyces lavenduligriseus]|uniref:Helix-turn-helix domain-containing protein n=1 Tax=Streptomyces lavenduligriseus TaxID=67315 RepID=A0ABT0P373_9ACTN|nr:helix-turn-helix domain-containing protein [Streptomyces lavenduligriseus]MCL3998223.1 helix-turn-helix domain-containing protein [Streptomyces lavenduligriseus]
MAGPALGLHLVCDKSGAMIEKTFSTEDLSVTDRVDAWQEKLTHVHAPVDLMCHPDSDFYAQQRAVQLGDAFVWSSVMSSQTIRRTPQLIRRSDPEVIHLSLITRGTVGFRMDGPDALYGPCELRTNDSSHPFEILMGPEGGLVNAVSVDVPRVRLPLSSNDLDRVIGHRMSGQEGVGALLTAFLTAMHGSPQSFTAADAPRLETILVDLLAAVFAHTLDAAECLPAESRRRTLTLRIQAFIGNHLNDPGLTPPTIATAHHISVSYLHRLFQEHGLTVSGWIRRQRLENARRDLADPALRSIPIHVIAARWCFPRAADFSRAFRAAYGQPPSDYRNHPEQTLFQA